MSSKKIKYILFPSSNEHDYPYLRVIRVCSQNKRWMVYLFFLTLIYNLLQHALSPGSIKAACGQKCSLSGNCIKPVSLDKWSLSQNCFLLSWMKLYVPSSCSSAFFQLELDIREIPQLVSIWCKPIFPLALSHCLLLYQYFSFLQIYKYPKSKCIVVCFCLYFKCQEKCRMS